MAGNSPAAATRGPSHAQRLRAFIAGVTAGKGGATAADSPYLRPATDDERVLGVAWLEGLASTRV